ncbi:hypothetical protein BASA50_004020 [Batrachochytrium salamandrivorans]|uniref:Uncharacterized protein n=1 Tax=Batrachochytrium salamandrivorans TaxID=1357716 RepID=A0ABQ8FH09_9FUNG|nr:hypothetical protein BASA60_010458 [Batrachochytrium salamandrivorans]KAH6573554.1 hypothetical protein BASA62_002892 [Batrachochytrium salamandrivorans]KAH6598139.1 hypothetical protein BASA50_004020 [Batrachochytrium salamandrivorans]KAH6601933.1 hypothetical protein BASA61_001636 [Batrachochytrium salamandrivorans]KAH9244587.1 hypothetical protein BASA81_017994 [Batrachochytrium salamandrivorans]
MKFNALVVAAMVITSVNAGLGDKGDKTNWKGSTGSLTEQTGAKVKGWLVKGGSMFKSAMTRSQSLSNLNKEDKKDEEDEEDEEDAEIDPVCPVIYTKSLEIQRTLSGLTPSFVDSMIVLSDIESKMENLDSEELQVYSAVRSEVRTELQAIETKYTTLSEKYYRYLEMLEVGECPDKSDGASLPKELMPLDAYLDEDLKSLDYKTNDNSDLGAPEEQEGDDSDLGASGWQ